MTPNNNLSVLPWYYSSDDWNARKWWVYDRIYPLFTPAGFILPFQILLPQSASHNITWAVLVDANTGNTVSSFSLSSLQSTGLTTKYFPGFGYDVILYPGRIPAISSLPNGRYYIIMSIDNHEYFSEVFTVVNDIEPYLKIEWWDNEDLIMDAGAVVYSEQSFRNILYLKADIAKPEYIFNEDGEERDGYFFPIKQISYKKYRFAFLAPEYLLDVMRLIRLSDHVEITKNGQIYNADTFLITPEWEKNGDVAAVDAEFTADTVAKKIWASGSSPIITTGDFNNDFNNDFSN